MDIKLNLTEANVNALLSALRTLLVLVGGFMAAKGLEHTTVYSVIMTTVGAITFCGAGAWGIISAIQNIFKKDKEVAAGVQAGITMTVSGQALANDGKTITSIGDGAAATPPKQVTVETAKQIVKDFAPPAEVIAKT